MKLAPRLAGSDFWPSLAPPWAGRGTQVKAALPLADTWQAGVITISLSHKAEVTLFKVYLLPEWLGVRGYRCILLNINLGVGSLKEVPEQEDCLCLPMAGCSVLWA